MNKSKDTKNISISRDLSPKNYPNNRYYSPNRILRIFRSQSVLQDSNLRPSAPKAHEIFLRD